MLNKPVTLLLSLFFCASALANIQPVVECIDNNGDGTYTARWRYAKDFQPATIIEPGTNNAQSKNYFTPAPQPVPYFPGQPGSASDPFIFTNSQPSESSFTTTFSDTLSWIIGFTLSGGYPIGPFCAAAASSQAGCAAVLDTFQQLGCHCDAEGDGGTVGDDLPCCVQTACGSVTPTGACIDKLANGSLIARFGYNNSSAHARKIAVGPLNTLTPSSLPAAQPTLFLPGNIVNAFSVAFDPAITPSVSWSVDGNSASASSNSPACSQAPAPSCAIVGTLTKNCTGQSTVFSLDSSGSGPASSYYWSTTCENALISDAESAKTSISLANPGIGIAAQCAVTLTVSNGATLTTCSTPVNVPACQTDCRNADGSSAKIDDCGVCGGNNSCFDCNGVKNGPAKKDQCGLCGGDGTTCLGCADADISSQLFALDGNASRQAALVRRAAAEVRRSPEGKSKIVRSTVRKLAVAANVLYNDNWTLTWSLPRIVSSCTNQILCTTIDNSVTLTSYRSRAAELRNIVGSVLEFVADSKNSKLRNKVTALKRRAGKRYGEAISVAAKIPATSSACVGPV